MGNLSEDLDKGNKEYPTGSSKFFNFEEGNNAIRVVSSMEVFGQHYIPGVGYKVCIGKENGCQSCLDDNKPSPSWFCWVIDRKDGLIKEAKLSYTVLKSLDDITEIEEHQFVPQADGVWPYDVNIRMIEGKKKNEKRNYNIIPAGPTSITEEEAEKIKLLPPPMKFVEDLKAKELGEAPPPTAGDEVNVDDLPL
tara:strand:+ start:1080 stop:1661 length:582 start_codon:yes stop_codon:yes gene_type:complete